MASSQLASCADAPSKPPRKSLRFIATERRFAAQSGKARAQPAASTSARRERTARDPANWPPGARPSTESPNLRPAPARDWDLRSKGLRPPPCVLVSWALGPAPHPKIGIQGPAPTPLRTGSWGLRLTRDWDQGACALPLQTGSWGLRPTRTWDPGACALPPCAPGPGACALPETGIKGPAPSPCELGPGACALPETGIKGPAPSPCKLGPEACALPEPGIQGPAPSPCKPGPGACALPKTGI